MKNIIAEYYASYIILPNKNIFFWCKTVIELHYDPYLKSENNFEIMLLPWSKDLEITIWCLPTRKINLHCFVKLKEPNFQPFIFYYTYLEVYHLKEQNETP